MVKRSHRSNRHTHGLLLSTVLVITLLVAGCDVSRMMFVQDHRVAITAPADRDTVTLPFTLRWQTHGFAVTGRDGQRASNSGYFAIFVDRAPMPPGQTLEWLATQSDSCGSEACGSVDRLSDVYTTSDMSLELRQLPAVNKTDTTERHEAVVILLDGTGTRIGESGFYVRFDFERKG